MTNPLKPTAKLLISPVDGLLRRHSRFACGYDTTAGRRSKKAGGSSGRKRKPVKLRR